MANKDSSDDVDMGFINPEDDEPLARPVFHAPVAQDFRDDPVSLAPEDRQFELAGGRANYPNAALLQEEMASGRWWLYRSTGGGEIEWGVAALPANRPDGDTCAWMRPSTDGHYGYCYVVPCGPPTSHAYTFPTPVSLTEEDQEGLVKVVFWGAGYKRSSEPNVRGGDLVPFVRVGGIALGIGYLDRPLGSAMLTLNPLVTTAGTPEGWVLLDSDVSTNRMPNTAVTTLGAEITNINVQETILVAAGQQDHPGDAADEYPVMGIQGAVQAAAFVTEITPNGTAFTEHDIWGSYYVVLHRIN